MQIGHVAEGIRHAQEVEAGVRERQLLPDSLDQVAARSLPRLVEHAGAWVQPDDVAGRAHQTQGALGGESGTAGDVEHLHARREARAAERPPPVPETRAEPDHLVDRPVLVGRAVEQLVQESLAGLVRAVVVPKRRMRRDLHGRRSVVWFLFRANVHGRLRGAAGPLDSQEAVGRARGSRTRQYW